MKKYYLSILMLLMVNICCTKLTTLADFNINTYPLDLTINNVVIDTNTASITLQLNNKGNLNLVKSGFYYDTNSINTSTSPKIDISANNYSPKLISLVYGKKYYLRSFVQAIGTNEPVYYGKDTSFTIPFKIPTIRITNISNITIDSATVNVNFINYNNVTIDSAGVAFSSSNNVPTKQNGLVALTNKGILIGNYNVSLTTLNPNTTYYVRAYFYYNGTIYYGNVQTFTTTNLPTITTNAVTNITNTTATANINISNPNSLNITAAGIAYSRTNNTPTIADSYVAHSSTGNLAGNYTLNLSSLTTNTTYYVRGYINYNGTIYYGNVQIFTTTNIPTTIANLEANMVTVPAGSFTMGATSEQLANNGDDFGVSWTPATQQVTLSSYKICRFEVTQQLWVDVMGSNPSYFNGGSYGTNLQRPVEQVSWDDCQTFIIKLNQLTGKTYRLPTEAEWEYAARGGAGTTYSYIYSGSNTANDVAWYVNNSSNQTKTIGTKQANVLGIYDMSGNVWEWCNDFNGNYSNTPVTNPNGTNPGFRRVVRGGSWDYFAQAARVSIRGNNDYNQRGNFNGFRLALDNTILHTITTNAATFITNTTATGNISISNPNSINITAAGIAFSRTNSTPTTADNYLAHSSTGNLAGNYTLNLSSLTANTTYYLRGYINYNGTIYYGSVQTFTTLATLPTLPTTLNLANLEANMLTVPAGSFTMGATSEQLADNGDGFSVSWSPTTQQVTLSSYKICRFEVTQQLWLDVMGSNPSSFTSNLQRPVENVSWDDCQTFISTLNQLTGKTYRLPFEAEWEYASRGGASTAYSYIYSGSNTLDNVAWYGFDNNSNRQTHTIGTKQANALGIYDMTGNVWEWCQDWYGNYSSAPVTNPQGTNSGSGRVLRGGSWDNPPRDTRISNRSNYSSLRHNVGLRLVNSSN